MVIGKQSVLSLWAFLFLFLLILACWGGAVGSKWAGVWPLAWANTPHSCIFFLLPVKSTRRYTLIKVRAHQTWSFASNPETNLPVQRNSQKVQLWPHCTEWPAPRREAKGRLVQPSSSPARTSARTPASEPEQQRGTAILTGSPNFTYVVIKNWLWALRTLFTGGEILVHWGFYLEQPEWL